MGYTEMDKTHDGLQETNNDIGGTSKHHGSWNCQNSCCFASPLNSPFTEFESKVCKTGFERLLAPSEWLVPPQLVSVFMQQIDSIVLPWYHLHSRMNSRVQKLAQTSARLLQTSERIHFYCTSRISSLTVAKVQYPAADYCHAGSLLTNHKRKKVYFPLEDSSNTHSN